MTGNTLLLRLTPLATALALLPAQADTSAAVDAAAADALPAVSITATRLAKDADAVAPNVSVLAPEGEDAGRVHDIQSLFADEPGVDVARDPARRGNAGVSIRGIDGNRVQMSIDGVNLPQVYMGGGAAISGRDMVELDSLSAVEVVKGPYSGLYGADALGGIVAYRSLNVADLLDKDASVGGRMRLGYYGVDDSYKAAAAAALRSVDVSALFSYTRRQGENNETQGKNDSASSARTTANPLDWHSDALLAKLNWQLARGHSLGFTQDSFRRHSEGDYLSSRSAAVLAQTSTDTMKRDRSSLSYDYQGEARGLSAAHVSVYRQYGESREDTLESRAGNVRRTNNSGFEQTAWGIDTQLTQRFDQGSLLHTVVWGADYDHTESSRPRMRTQINANGSVSTVVAGEVFPQKTFPDNDSEKIGLFVQDEIAFASGLLVTPSLRYDRYSLTPKPDALYANANPNPASVRKSSDSAVSPRLMFSLPLAQGWTGFAQFGTGFRTPNFDDGVLVFVNAAQGYEIRPNPDLKAETSRSMEFGTRYQGERFELAATAYQNRYKNFIASTLVSAVDTNANGVATEFQAQNLGRIRIQGLELKAAWRLLPQLKLRGALAYAKADDLESDVPYDGVEPLNGLLALDYAGQGWGSSLSLRGARAKTRTSAATLFQAPGYGVLDLSASYQLTRQASLQAGIYNLADKKYWLWSDVKGQAAASTVLDRYTQAGRTAAANFEYRF
ncbi:hemoglobin/transferrin/lactoferrin receptor protein [Chitinimonas taiwanensis DSM 18899]|uniref:Hemoglobin/transferrin/lactoferrin receptor protein n=1 Tax=Chitinimonas taiwanensis DSM 18899 TaxID=1121279 RepID=A0A1K2HMZ2_9NEIS|nr:hemoglobin/transferrin/lactoferrin receptor protein [Chitinimonas taiwanensis DSM 18899]